MSRLICVISPILIMDKCAKTIQKPLRVKMKIDNSINTQQLKPPAYAALA